MARSIVLAFFTGCLGLLPPQAAAQPANVPAAYRDLYTLLDSKIAAFDRTVSATWSGRKPPVDFSAELALANANRGVDLLSASALPGIQLELQRLQQLGMKAVTIAIGFPVFDPGFHQFNGTTGDYPRYVDFYRQLAASVRNRKMKVVIKSGVLFPGFYSSRSGFNLSGYYASLSTDQYIAAKTQHAVNIVTNLQPDYVSLGSEPDVEALLLGKPSMGTPAAFAGLIQQNLARLRVASSAGTSYGAGIGTWQSGAAEYIRQLAATNLDWIDLHIYPVNFDFFINLITYTDLALSLGKQVAISEAWLLKQRDAEFSTANVAMNPEIFSRDAFEFWAPLDESFFNAMSKFAYWKRLLFVSPFWTRYFYGYLDYDRVRTLSPEALVSASLEAAAAGIVAGRFTPTAEAYRAQANSGGSRLVAISAASLALGNVAPDSLVSLFGANFSAAMEAAPSLPLPTTLAGSTVKITDSGGGQQLASLIFVSPGQVNAVLPANVSSGQATLEVASSSNAVSLGSVTVSAVAPGLFTANQDGKGAPSAFFSRYGASGLIGSDYVFQCTAGVGTCSPAPLEIGPASETEVIELYGTGIRNRQALTDAQATIGGIAAPVMYAGAQAQYPGLDQVNVQVPKALAGRGEVTLQLVVAGVAANPVTLRFR
ncbi:MAG: hypothetical protein ACE15B_11190 [Bryobacteraceae bacterium]